MKHLFSLALVLILLSCGAKNQSNSAQTANSTATIPMYCNKYFKGTINKNLAIELELSRNSAGLTGTYVYTKHGETIALNGEYSEDGTLVLREYSRRSDTITGKFKGKYDGKTISGTWQNADSSKVFPLELTEQSTNGISFKEHTMKDSLRLEGKKDLASATYSYLQATDYADKKALKSFSDFAMNVYFEKAKVSENPMECIKKTMADYFDMYRNDTQDIDDESTGGFMWDNDNSMSIEFNDKQLLCFAINNYSFMGGAHGNMSSFYHTYDLKNLKELKKDDIFIKGYEEKIIPLLKAAIIKQYPEGLSILNDPDSLAVSENIYVTRFGIGFFYNTYEAACYAVGQIDLVLPYRQIKAFLKPESLVYPLAQ